MANPDLEKPRKDTFQHHQANERTLLSWIRTGIALMAFGFAIARFGVFLHQVAAIGTVTLNPPPSLGSGVLGAALVALGTLTSLLATLRYAKIRAAIERGETGAPGALLIYVMGATAAIIGLVMTILLTRTFED